MRKIAILLLLSSCVSTEVIGFTEPIVVTDTTTKKPYRPLPPVDTTDRADTARFPIGWNPSVGDWSEQNQDIYGH